MYLELRKDSSFSPRLSPRTRPSLTHLIMNGSYTGSVLQSSGTTPLPGAILRLQSNPVDMACLLDLWPRPLDTRSLSDLLRLPLVGVEEGAREVKMKV